MKATLPFFVFTVLFSSAAMAQCGGGSSSSSSDDGGSSWNWGGFGSDSDYSSGGSSEWTPVPFRIGYGRRYILQDYTKIFSDRIPEDKGWWLSRPQHVIGFSYAFGKDERFSVGSSVLFTRLAQKEESARTYNPPAADPGKEPAPDMYPLETEFDKSASLIGQTIDVEYVFASVADDHLRAFAHADVGYTIYNASAGSYYNDTCGCSHRAVEVDGGSTVGTASLGVGVQAQFAFVGVKAQLGFQFQQANTFVTRQQYDAWQPEFDEAAYNYQGIPDNSLFRISGSEYERVRSRTNQLYFQVTGYIYLGWSRY
jgi:hypothetical protein